MLAAASAPTAMVICWSINICNLLTVQLWQAGESSLSTPQQGRGRLVARHLAAQRDRKGTDVARALMLQTVAMQRLPCSLLLHLSQCSLPLIQQQAVACSHL